MKKYTYDLVSLIIHRGTQKGGHYTNVSKRDNEVNYKYLNKSGICLMIENINNWSKRI